MAPRKVKAHQSPLPKSRAALRYSAHEIIDTTTIPSPPLDPPLPPPPPSTRTNVELNLSVLRRYLPATESILLVAPYAALYTFQPSAEEWEKSSIQGTLFVVRLEPSPFGSERYATIILNRYGLKNFILELQPGADVELEDEIVVVRGGAEDDGMIWGIWIYEEGENTSTAGLRGEVERLVKSCVEASGVEEGSDGNEDHSGNETHPAHEDDDYKISTHISPVDVSTHQEPQDHPMHRTGSGRKVGSAPSQTQSEPEHDHLGALFRKAMLNFRGSS